MNKRLFQLLLLPVMICAIFTAGLLSATGVAHAATAQTHSPNIAAFSCASGDVELKSTTDGIFCLLIEGTFTFSPPIPNVSTLITGNFTVSWNWVGCNGSTHSSSKPPHTTLTSRNASPNGFAGCPTMAEVNPVTLS